MKRLRKVRWAAILLIAGIVLLGTVSARGTTHNVVPGQSIQAAIDVAKHGDTINVADGTYTITSKILVNKEVTIAGNVSHPENVIVQYSAPTNSLMFDMRANDVTVEGIKTISGKSGFFFDQGATGCKISHCIIENTYESGVYIYNGSGHTVEYTTISNPGQMGNLSYSNGVYTRAASTIIDNCVITSDKINYMKWGVDVEAGSNHVVTDTTITGSWQAAVRVAGGAKSVTITNNDIDDATEGYAYEAAISLAGNNDGSTISGNHIDNIIASAAIYVYPAWGVTIADNQIGLDDVAHGIHWDGIRVDSCGGSGVNRVEITGNAIHNTGYAAIIVINSDNAYVYNNTITECNNYGADGTGDWDYASIHIDEDSSDVIVDSNTISDGVNGIQIWGDSCSVTNNTIYNMGLTYGASKTVGADTYWNSGIIIGGMPGIGVSPTGVTVLRNTITGNVVGLFVHYAIGNSANSNSIYSNSQYGVQNTDAATIDASGNWWGTTDPTVVAGLVSSLVVDFTPMLDSGVDGDLSKAGWQPDLSAMTVHTLGEQVGTAGRIQEGINQVDVGGTVQALAGTYVDDIWDASLGWPEGYRITKSMTLLGAQADNDPAGSTDRGGESIMTRSNGLPYSLYVPNITINGMMNGDATANSGGRFIIGDGADDATIKYCIIQNTSPSAGHGVYIYAGAERAIIIYNTIANTSWEGVASWQASGATVSHNVITSPGAGIPAIQWMGHDGSNNIITYNVISGVVNSQGINYWGGPNATLSYNELIGDGTMYDGIAVDNAADGAVVHSNEITNTIYAGISMKSDATGIQVTNNVISGCGTAVEKHGGDSAGIVVHYNSLTGNAWGIANYDAADLDAMLNWWGDMDGPTAYSTAGTVYDGGGDLIWGNVIFSPWLGIDPDGNPTLPGVQITGPMLIIVAPVGPDPTGGYLNPAIAGANSPDLPFADTIEVKHGTYDASTSITQPVNIVSETGSAAHTTLSGNMTLGSSYVVLGRRGQGFTVLGTITVPTGTNASTIHANWNNLLGAMLNQGTGTLDAILNYWGDPNGPSAGEVAGTVAYSPWLGLAADDSPTLFVVAPVGSEPAAGYLNTAIAAANDLPGTDTIEVKHGTYDGSEPITEAVNIVSETGSAAHTTLNGNMSIDGNGVLVGLPLQGFRMNGNVTVGAGANAASSSINWCDLYGSMTNNGTGTFNAQYNYWGTLLESVVDARTTGLIDYEPFLPENADDSYVDATAIIVAGLASGIDPAIDQLWLMVQLGQDVNTFIAYQGVAGAGAFAGAPAGATINLGGAAGGGGAVEGAISGTYTLGEPIDGRFTLTDPITGEPVTDAAVTTSLLGPDGSLVFWGCATYDETTGEYVFTIDTSGLAPGTYELIIQTDDGQSKTVSIEVLGA